MDKNKVIILALIIVIAALLVGMAAMMMPNMSKQDTKLKFKSNSTLTEGDSIKIQLIDANGTAIANQTVNITITDKDKSNSYYSVITNEKGVGTLKLDKSAGKYIVAINYGGNDKYNGCNDTKKITIEEEKVTQTEESSNTNVQELEFNGKTHEQNVQEAKESRAKGLQWAGATDEQIEEMVSKEERDGGRI